jgi:diguanylate cyclase (GGDEF)-like protein
MKLTAVHGQPGTSDPTARFGPVALTIAALLIVFTIDRQTNATPLQHLYYLPIIFAGARFRMAGGVLTALSAILLYHLANPHLLTFRYGEADIVQLALFLVVGVVTARLTIDANRLRSLAMTDDLTGLRNLRSFESGLATMISTARAAGGTVGMLVLDLDHLKSLNDRYGHLTGAEAVRTVGHIIADRLPPGAIACRYGGDEFAIAVAPCEPAQLLRAATELRVAVQSSDPVLAERHFAAGTLTVSIGGSRVCLDLTDPARAPADIGEELFGQADGALYRAKAGGRNQIHMTSPSCDPCRTLKVRRLDDTL